MIKITLCAEALNRVRLNYSPMWETVCSLRTFLHPPGNHLHTPWAKWARPRIEPELTELLRGLMPSPGHFPDFLTPPTAAHPRSFQAELAALAETDPANATEEIERCWDGRPPAAISALLA